MRLMIGIVFVDSGWTDLKNPQERSQSIVQNRNFTIFLGTSEILGGAAVLSSFNLVVRHFFVKQAAMDLQPVRSGRSVALGAFERVYDQVLF